MEVNTPKAEKPFIPRDFRQEAAAEEITSIIDNWRRERNCRPTLSGPFSMTYKPHKLRWMLPGESRGVYGDLQASHGRPPGGCAATKTASPRRGRLHQRRGASRPPATGDIIHVLVRRWCRPGRYPRLTSHAGRSKPHVLARGGSRRMSSIGVARKGYGLADRIRATGRGDRLRPCLDPICRTAGDRAPLCSDRP
jgi:hypothetical protein